MRYLKILICLYLLLFLWVSFYSTAEENAFVKNQTENKEKDSNIAQAEMWNQKGEIYYKKKKYTEAIEYYQKAVEINPIEVKYIVNLTRAYRDNEKFVEAEKLIKEALKKFLDKEEQKNLYIELADVHIWWAYNLLKRYYYDYTGAMKHYKIAYNIDKVHRPKNCDDIDLNNIGSVYSALEKQQKALYIEKTLHICRAVGDRALEARTLSKIGRMYSELGQEQKALEYYEKALPISRAVGDRAMEAETLHNIGFMYSDLGQKQKALTYFKKTLHIWRARGDRALEAKTLSNIGHMYSALVQKQKALEYYEKALLISRTVGDRYMEAENLSDIGRMYSDLGQKQKALEYYEKALQTMRAAGNLYWEAEDLNNIGVVYSDLFQKQKALMYYEKALSIRREIGNRSGEATTLNDIGQVYFDLGKKQKALEYYEKSLKITRTIGNRSMETTTLNNIGAVYSDLGENQKALEYYEEALPIMQAVGNRSGEARTLSNIGTVYSALGENQKALEYYEKALPINRAIGNRSGEARNLIKIGTVYSGLGLHLKALEYYEKALPINRAVGDRSGEAHNLNWSGGVYFVLGQKQKALTYYEKALHFYQAVGYRRDEAHTLNDIGTIYYAFGQEHKALEYYEEALPIMQAAGNRSGEARTLSNIGTVYSALGQKHKALDYYQKSLSISRIVGNQNEEANNLAHIGSVYSFLGEKQKSLGYLEKALSIIRAVGNRNSEAAILNNIGLVYDSIVEKQKSLEYFQRSLPIIQAVSNLEGEAKILGNLMFFLASLQKLRLSIFYGKQSVNLFQKLRTEISILEKKIQISYLETKKDTYRKLIDLLITEGRLLEAQQVLDMLKGQEYFDYIRRDNSAANILSTQVDFTEYEKQWLEKYNNVLEKLSGTSNEYHILKLKKNKTYSEKNRMEELEPKLKKNTKAYEDFLAQLKEAFDKYEKEIKEGKIDPDTLAKKASALQETLKYLDEKEGGKHVAIHYLLYEGRISVIITTPSHQLKKQAEINEKEFNQLVMNYRDFIMKSPKTTRDARPVDTSTDNEIEKNPYEKKLFDIIFKPVDENLKKYGATNLLVSLDGVLRYIPLAALWDGKSYLVQRYRMTLLTPSSLKNIKDEPLNKRKILGFGASSGGQGLKRLPNVRREIKAIVKDKEKGYNGLIEGKAFLDKDFTKEAMVNELKQKEYPLVHIASHFKFSPGDETKNFLLLGDGNIMKLSEIRGMGNLFDNVNLLVLSACQTGVGGNGEEIDGFGELAQQSGAKSVVASLWSVEDESTKDLMVAFYRIIKERKVTSKIEALRQAQLELAGLEDLLQKTQKQQVRSKTKFSHPYYWGPFIMIGNWR